MEPVTTFRGQLEHEHRTRVMRREAEQHALAKLAAEGTPTLWQRIHARLSQVQITAPTVRIVMKQPTKAAS